MATFDTKKPLAWQPFTWRGVAAFAHARLGRLLLVQLVVALLAAAAVVGFLHECWFPVIREAIEHLPAEGQIRQGKLDWYGDSPAPLAENRFLGLAVDLLHEGEARSPAHVQAEFGRTDVKLFSLLGFTPVAYPKGWAVAFNRTELLPWWGAWMPMLLALAALGVVAALFAMWALLATAYSGPVWLAGFFANRDLPWRASWRLAGAALMPGALFQIGAILLYAAGGLDLILLGLAAATHLLIGWVYVCTAPFYAPPQLQLGPGPDNPFTPPSRV